MGKSYKNLAQGTDNITKPRNMLIAAPYDVRTVVDSYNDLLDRNVFTFGELYVGLLVITKDTQDVYVLSQLPGQRDSAAKWAENIKWRKVSSSEINPENYLEYYEEKLGAKVVDSFEELTSANLGASFAGLLGVVKASGESESEDESGLYVLTREPNTTPSNWYKILGGNSGGNASSGLDVTEVITSDGSAPAAGTGFSINGNDPEGMIEETYVDDNGFEPGKYYTSRGLNSSDENGGEGIEADYITLTNGGDSYIKLNSGDDPNWIELNIVDDSLGFTMDDVTWIDENGVEHQMTENPLVLPKETPISFGDNPINFNGMTETRGEDPTEYIFGDTGSTYDEADIYTSSVLPTVYAYADGEAVRVLTEGDKDEILAKIEENAMEPLTREEVLSVF